MKKIYLKNNSLRFNRKFSRIIPNQNTNFDHYNHRMNQQINEVDERNNFLNNNDLNEEEKNEINNEINSDNDIEKKKNSNKKFL
jgi:hypothetical protein